MLTDLQVLNLPKCQKMLLECLLFFCHVCMYIWDGRMDGWTDRRISASLAPEELDRFDSCPVFKSSDFIHIPVNTTLFSAGGVSVQDIFRHTCAIFTSGF